MSDQFDLNDDDRPLNKENGPPPIVKRTHLAGRLLTIYACIWFAIFSYQFIIVDEKQYAIMGLVTFSIVLMMTGYVFSGIHSRWQAAKDEEDLRQALALTYVIGIPIGLVAFAMQCVVIACAVVWGWHSVLEVRATDEVKAELKWLLGEHYPEDEEYRIDPETLRWRIEGMDTAIGSFFLEAHSPSAKKEVREYFDKQWNDQLIEVTWKQEDGRYWKELDLEWERAELYSYQDGPLDDSYPICEMKVPIQNDDLDNTLDYEVLVNEKSVNKLLPEGKPFSFSRPSAPLPPVLRVEDQQFFVRLNYIGAWWATYCFINFPKSDPGYIPEPATSKSFQQLSRAKYQIHFYLLGALRNNIHFYESTRYRKLASYRVFIDELNDVVGLRILNKTIIEYGRAEIEMY